MGIEVDDEFLTDYNIKEIVLAILIMAKSMCDAAPNQWDLIRTEPIDAMKRKIEGSLSTEEVLNAIHFAPEENTTFKYLKKWLKKCNEEKLAKFVEVLTGSSAIVEGKKLNVRPNAPENKETLPTFHTCSYQMDLPTTYDHYEKFKEKMDLSLSEALIGYQVI